MTGSSYLCLLGILTSARLTHQASAPTTAYYVGATVEYHPVTTGENLTAIINENVKNYMKFLKTASENDVDIIVFPENGLTSGFFSPEERSKYLPHSSYIPSPKDAKVPCHDQSTPVMEALKAISCAANRFKMYIAVNIREKEQCTGDKCSKDGHNLYNTNVVFDRSGAVVARYRKYNLFGEQGSNKTSKPEISTFKTDFDVTFGQIICFDILFEAPTLRLVRERKITDILFSSHWFSELPFLTAPQVQSAWSWINDVNFLASGYNSPATGSGGSGIYAGKNGVLKRVWSEKRTNAIIISQVPKVVAGSRAAVPNPTGSIIYPPNSVIPTINGSEPVMEQKLLSDYVLPYTTKVFVPVNGTSNATVCDRGLCCRFLVDSTHNEALIKEANVRYYRYRFAVFNGIRSFSGKATGGIEICALISCTDNDVKSCAVRFDTNGIIVNPTTFNSIKIAGNFSVMPNNIYLPINMNHELQPLNITDFTFTMKILNKTHTTMKYNLIKPRNDLMTFAIYGRNFSADGQPQTMSSAAERSNSLYFMFIMLVFIGIGSKYAIVSSV